MWTQFWDMHSGGGQKLSHPQIFIESASEAEAINIFCNRFGRHPHNVTCSCCGDDYSVSSDEELAQVTGYERGCDYNKDTGDYIEAPRNDYSRYMPLDEYITSGLALFIPASEVQAEERLDSGLESWDNYYDDDEYLDEEEELLRLSGGE